MKKLLTLTALAAVTLTACGEASNTNTPAVENQPAQVKNTQTNADTMLDQQIYSEAIRGDDATKCDAIIDKAKKTECGQVIQARLLTKDAVEKRDKGVCKGIELKRYEEQCEVGVDDKVKEDNKEKERKEADEKRYKIMKEASEKQDYTVCKQITDDLQKASCEFNIISNLPEVKNDKTLCQSISSKDLVEKCVNSTNEL